MVSRNLQLTVSCTGQTMLPLASPSPITWFNTILNPLPSALVQNRTDPTTVCKVTSHANWLCLF